MVDGNSTFRRKSYDEENSAAQRRRDKVAAVRHGLPLRAVARQFRVPLATVQHWVRRAAGRRLDRVDGNDRPRIPRHTHRTPTAVEDLVLDRRRQLRDHADLGLVGAEAIREELQRRGVTPCPRSGPSAVFWSAAELWTGAAASAGPRR